MNDSVQIQVVSAVLCSGEAGGPDETFSGAKPSAGAEDQTLGQRLPYRTR